MTLCVFFVVSLIVDIHIIHCGKTENRMYFGFPGLLDSVFFCSTLCLTHISQLFWADRVGFQCPAPSAQAQSTDLPAILDSEFNSEYCFLSSKLLAWSPVAYLFSICSLELGSHLCSLTFLGAFS